MNTSRDATIALAREYAADGRDDQWFEEFYSRAGGDIDKIYWADLGANPLLVDWVRKNGEPGRGKAVVIGCGLGDDAEFLASRGYEVTAFDISRSAINMCRARYPQSPVNYLVADLFAVPDGWIRGFDLVYECNTIQILTGENRSRALRCISELVGVRGCCLVSCRSREKGRGLDEFPVALDREEIDGFLRVGLAQISFLAYDDDQDPPVPHFFSVYSRRS